MMTMAMAMTAKGVRWGGETPSLGSDYEYYSSCMVFDSSRIYPPVRSACDSHLMCMCAGILMAFLIREGYTHIGTRIEEAMKVF